MRYLFLLGVLAFCQLAFAIEIHYSLRMAKPQSHYFQVEMSVKDLKQKSALVKLPVWAPGSYLVREFSKNLNQVKAVDGSGKSLNVVKVTKNAWEIELKGATSFVVKYEVYAFEQSVRTNFLDNTHGFVSGPAMFMYLDGAKDLGGTLDVIPAVTFKKVSTGLKSLNNQIQKGNAFSFRFENYDQLVDSPIEIGNHETFDFMAAGVKHTVAMYGEGNYNPEELKRDMAIIVEEETKVVGVNPNENYLFIVHNVIGGDGGLEHANSTVLSVDRWTYAGSEYLSFLNLVAHEYFHLWNVKRIRPIALGPFNYDQEVYTNLLWVMEGFTSYYDELILRRCGFYTQEVFLKKIQSSINYVEGSLGSRVQPVSHASFDAWIKAYRPNENSANTTMTYYSRGAVLGAVFDAMVIKHSKGKQGLDHVLKHLYETYHVGKKRGFTDAEFKEVLEKFTGQDLTDFYKKYIDGTEVIPYSTYFLPLGIEVSDVGGMKPVFGASVSDDGGKVMVKSIRTGSSAEDAGLSVNDEIISCMGYRVDKAMLEGIMNGMEIGEETVLFIARDQIMQEVKVKITGTHKSQYIFKTHHDDSTLPLYTYWLR
ncbi:MAG: M61 family peptidase [Flavobacteriia bacterium]|nr:M61 family peptidase [Flavobacteriia bacterium]NBV68516.1 M61 family peptidase [Flavobacteriia bacterium]NBV90752.1 M61 family peptidase [Flavobacteriia bacterium]NBY40759.1 M61 family peptidase [Flavobacteriia bacterium]